MPRALGIDAARLASWHGRRCLGGRSAALDVAFRTFDGFVEYAKRVSPTCLIHLDRNRYSVPASFANRPVSVRVYPQRIVVAAEGQVVCEHRRVFARSHQRKSTTTVFDWRHYLAVIQRKPGALRNGAPFAELPLPSEPYNSVCSRRRAATARWSRSSPWSPARRASRARRRRTGAGDRRANEDAYSEPAAPLGRRKADGHASDKGAAGSDFDERTAG